jgi:hypothetical protein
MKALIINCTLKSSPERSNTAALAEVVAEALRNFNAEIEQVQRMNPSTTPVKRPSPPTAAES